MKSNYYIVFILILGVLITSCGKTQRNTASQKAIIPVVVTPAKYGSVEQKIKFLGNVSAVHEVKVFSTVPTKITEIYVDVGSSVKKGQLLAVVDDEKIKQNVIQAEAGLEAAKAQYRNLEVEFNRIKRLYDENAVSKAQFDQIKTQFEATASNVKQLEAVLANAKNQLKDCYITAPIDGIVSARNLNVGDQASPQIPLFTIVKVDQVKVDIDVIEAQIGLVKVGQKAIIEVKTYPNKKFIGYVNKIYPTINPITRTTTVEILIDNREGLLKPGMYASVELVVNSRNNVLVIPKYAVLEKTYLDYLGGEISNAEVKVNRYVFVVNDSLAHMREITTGIEDGSIIEVVKGLKPFEKVVTLGQYNLYDSAKVTIVREER